MGLRHGGFGRTETRSSALWGSGNGGGDKKRSLGARAARIAVAPLVVLATVTPLAASAHDAPPPSGPDAYIAPLLERAAARDPNASLHVIVRSENGLSAARKAVQSVSTTDQRLPIADAVSADVTGTDLSTLANTPGLIVTPDALVSLDSSSKQLWPYAVRADKLWSTTASLLGGRESELRAPTIAIVDSGIDAGRNAFRTGRKSRVLKQVTMTTLTPNSPGDGRGHGTFVAGLAAGDARNYAGAAPSANLVSLDVMDDNGMARTSDVIAAANWILNNKDRYNIKVANFSLHSSSPSSFTRDPLDKAVERLWLNGVVVVTSAGNYGSASGPSGVRYAPANDPFVLTVGALDLKQSFRAQDHVAAPWSAYGYTRDGFAKPELVAPGRYMIGPVPPDSTLAKTRPAQKVGPDYMQLSGTSFSAAVVSGVAADLLALHPQWTPDQVKGALMLSARPDPNAAPLSTGVGEVDAAAANLVSTPPNPNLALENFVHPDPDDNGRPAFDAVSWNETAKTTVSWNQASWSTVSWDAAAWSLSYWANVSWDQVSYSDVSYEDVSYEDVSYDAVSYTDVSYEDAVLGDFLPGGYSLSAAVGALP